MLFYHEIVCCVYTLESPHRGNFNEYSQNTILMSTRNILLLKSREKKTKLSPFAYLPGVIINPQWLELPISRTNVHSPKGVRAIEARL